MSKYFKTNLTKRKNENDPFEANTQICHQKDEKKALENYSTWLLERHAVHNALAKKLHRQSGELLMNVGDESNQVKEEKAALEYTRIPQQFDKYRGNPEWWEFPPGLHNKCSCRRDQVVYFYQKTKVQKNEIPEIEKVGLPDFTKNEKMLFPRTRNVYRKWQDSDYRKKRVEQLSSLLENIEPHKPEFERLIVVGQNFPIKSEETQTIGHPTENESLSKEARRKISVYDTQLRLCLKINGVFFYEKSPSLRTSRNFYVLFEYDVLSMPLHTQYIVFENVGRVTVRICWRKVKKFRLFREISRKNNTDFFCFDKNMLILVPGQLFNFPVWFRTNKVGTVVETWEISTVPKIWSEPIKVCVVLQAQTHIENFMDKIKDIKLTISQRVKKRIIKEILEDITNKTKYPDYKKIDYFYYEPELFEAMNLDESLPWRKPKYQYDADTVVELKEFYAAVRQPYHPKTWNLCVWDLQVLARVKDLIEYAERRTYEFSRYILTTSKSEFIGSDIKIRLKTSSLLLDNKSDSFLLKETRYGHLMKLLSNMAPPSISVYKERLKFSQVYAIFRAYFTLISWELHEISPFPSVDSERQDENCNRLIFEEFDETQQVRTKRSVQEDTTAHPKPEILRDVSVSDVPKIHKLYFAKSSSDIVAGRTVRKLEKPGAKKGKQEDMRVSKAKPSQMASMIAKTTLEEVGLVNLDFDPYEDIPDLPKMTQPTKILPSLPEEVPLRSNENYRMNYLNIYVTIHTHLSEAVDAMVDVLESAKEHKVPHENIEQLKNCFKLFIEEETETEDKPVNPFTNPEERDYFEKILKAHLNDITGKYLICGKTEPVTLQKHEVTCLDKKEEMVHMSDAPSMFSIFKPLPYEARFEERAAQTQGTSDSFEYPSFLPGAKDICECPSEYRNVPAAPTDLFYYSDDEVFDEQEKRRESLSSGGSGEGPEKEKKPAYSSGGSRMSLIKIWNKKKCSKEQLEEMMN